ncbi:MAG: putative lipid II flippase FtsW [Candidatus Anoxychlamydiales bacterium]|nr:putative lipid II flippase FtsW [Candidatus Anoxychlamydiales bacterium]NGX36544.1 putative lipid II flippase FtsW [Candidatus Anoxychlamydiales bacterium]
MWDHRYLTKVDLKQILIILFLMGISLLVISSMTAESSSDIFFTRYVKNQIQWFVLGWAVFLFFAGFDYRRFYQWTWGLYLLMILLLLGLYFASPIQSVHRWYKVPFIGMNIQPSEYAKLIVVFTLGWFLEKQKSQMNKSSTSLILIVIVAIPFFLILKQPDLGTALVLFPITLTMCYFGGANNKFVMTMTILSLVTVIFVGLIFSKVLSHEKMKPLFTKVLKEYQYQRFDPDTYHQKASQSAIAIGGVSGSGWKKSEFSSQKWLPAAHTDSVFASFGEEFGFIGLIFLLGIFYLLIHISFQVVSKAKDYYGRLLASGLAVYLAMHIIVNIAMMCGFLPISGVPLILISYGGNSVLTTMASLGILQSIYSRRFMF